MRVLYTLMSALLVMLGCGETGRQSTADAPANDRCYEDRPNNEMVSVIVYKNNITPQDTLALSNLGLQHTFTCPCDSNLQLWGRDYPIYGHDGLANNGTPPPGGASGGELIASIKSLGFDTSPNYIITTPDSTLGGKAKYLKLLPSVKSKQPPLIGVMDSGIASNNYWENPYDRNGDNRDNDRNGLKDDFQGWNFVDNNNRVNPGSTHPHGKMVTYLIERELQTYKNYRIVPMVVLGAEKKGKLSNMLCAMAYASRIEGLRVLNASLGYYGYSSDVLGKMIEKLKRKDIMLITAAGNADPSDSCEVVNGNRYPRNLSARNHKFYPASYSDTHSNVGSATTFYKGSIAPYQNYSNQYVNVGVVGDSSWYFRFINTESPLVEYDWGTSYAAPVAAAVSFIQKTSPHGHAPVPAPIRTYNYATGNVPGLTNRIKNGTVLERITKSSK